MSDQLEEIKSKIDVVGFISEYLPLKKAGRNFKGLCPFHNEKTSSFVVSPDRQIWHCFGCQKGGDVFGFLMQMENLEFPEALEVLAKRAGIKLVSNFQMSEQGQLRDKILKINHLASEFYHYLLLNHRLGKQALDYALGRGVSKKSMDTFMLGWAPNSWDGLLRFLTKKGYSLKDIENAGLVVRRSDGNGYYDRFRGRLMFALKDARGNVLGFAGRTLDSNAKEAKYINTPETPVYIKGNILYGLDVTKEAVKKQDFAIVVEGELDLISSFQAGVANVVAIKGSALTQGHVNLLKRFTQNISLSLDMDLAGDAAARRGIEIADEAGFMIKMIKIPQGKDPDECARSSPGLWQKAVKEGVPVFDYVLDSAISRFGKETADGKKKIGDEVIPFINKISNPIVQSHYASKLANLLGVSEDAIFQTAKKLAKNVQVGKTKNEFVSPEVKPQNRQEILEEQFLSILLQNEAIEELVKIENLSQMEEFLTIAPLKKIFVLLLKYLESSKSFDISEFVKSLPQELVNIVDRLYLVDLGESLKNKRSTNKEMVKTIMEIKKIFLKGKLLSLSLELKGASSEELDELKDDYRKTALALKACQLAGERV